MGEAGTTVRRWRSTSATQRSVLDAARDIFLERGYTAASIEEIVERSGVSVGSIYHHFGGKAGIFDALWREYNTAYSQAAQAAVSAVREAGEDDPVELFIAGAVGYLSVSVDPAVRKLAPLFQPGEGPPGTYVRNRKRMQDAWVRSNAALLSLDSDVDSQLRAAVATAIVTEGEILIVKLDRAGAVETVTDQVAALLRKVLS
jgi:AcrR family transcriptional regulator